MMGNTYLDALTIIILLQFSNQRLVATIHGSKMIDSIYKQTKTICTSAKKTSKNVKKPFEKQDKKWQQNINEMIFAWMKKIYLRQRKAYLLYQEKYIRNTHIFTYNLYDISNVFC